jgi:hypothetical protein
VPDQRFPFRRQIERISPLWSDSDRTHAGRRSELLPYGSKPCH